MFSSIKHSEKNQKHKEDGIFLYYAGKLKGDVGFRGQNFTIYFAVCNIHR
jgi:hypothetical protein